MALPGLCETCGTRHHSYQGHVFPATPSRVTKAEKVVVDAPVVVDAVVDTVSHAKPVAVDIVVDRSTKDRHRKTAARRLYLRMKQRESRARRRVSA